MNGYISEGEIAALAWMLKAWLTSDSAPGRLDEHAEPLDRTDLNATTSLHGLLPKGPGSRRLSLRGDISWGYPVGSLIDPTSAPGDMIYRPAGNTNTFGPAIVHVLIASDSLVWHIVPGMALTIMPGGYVNIHVEVSIQDWTASYYWFQIQRDDLSGEVLAASEGLDGSWTVDLTDNDPETGRYVLAVKFENGDHHPQLTATRYMTLESDTDTLARLGTDGASEGWVLGLDADLLPVWMAAATPAAHTHDTRYYTKTELNTSGAGGQVHWNNLTSVPSLAKLDLAQTFTKAQIFQPDSDVAAAKFKAFTGAASNITEWRKADDTLLAAIGPSGVLKTWTNGDKFALYEDDVAEADAYLKLTNATGSAGVLAPWLHLRGNGAGSLYGALFEGDVYADDVTDTGYVTIFRSSHGSAGVTNRPLFAWQNYATTVMFIDKSGILNLNYGLIFAEGKNLAVGTTTGTKIGTSASQKLGFWNAAPVVQGAHIANADGTLADLTTKFNTLLTRLETPGILASA